LEVLQVGSVQAGKRLGKIGGVDAAGVLRHGLFSSKVDGRRPYHRGMRHHLTGSLWLLLLRVAASTNHSLNRRLAQTLDRTAHLFAAATVDTMHASR
jgi:hypothetical protein